MDYQGFPLSSGGGGSGPVAYPVGSDGKSSVVGDIPMYTSTSGTLITDSGVLASNIMLRSGSTMTGDLNMNGHNITNVEFPLSIQNVTITNPGLTIALNPDVDLVVIDSRSFVGSASLGAPSVNTTIWIQLAYQASYAVTIMTSHGSITLNSSTPVVKLAYSGAAWIIIGSSSTLGNFPPQVLVSTKLTPVGFVGTSGFLGYNDMGMSVDGLYICYGISNDDSYNGAAYIWFYNGSAWSQQARLQGTGNTGPAQQGTGCRISGTGEYLAVGGRNDNSDLGAAWIFKRTGSSWAQQQMIVPTGIVGGVGFFGASLCMDSGGQLLFVGAPGDNSGEGSFFVFSRSGSTWTQIQRVSGSTAGTDTTAGFGTGVVCSADGHWLFVSAPFDSSDKGAVCVYYSLDLLTWAQVGSKTVAPIPTASAFFGSNMHCSASGNMLCVGDGYTDQFQGQNDYYAVNNGVLQFLTIIIGTHTTPSLQTYNTPGVSADGLFTVIGGPTDNTSTGSMWFTQDLGTGYQQIGPSINVTGELGAAQFGYTNACSSNGSVVCSTGPLDNVQVGAIWVFQ